MKKILLAVALLAGVATVSAQGKGKIGAGAFLNYGIEAERLGAGARLQYGVTDNIRLDANVTYFFPKNHASGFDVSLNAQYVIPFAEKFSAYPLAGVAFLGDRVSVAGVSSDTETRFGVNLGAGLGYNLTPSLSIGAEFKYIFVKNANTPVIGAGLTFSI